MGHSNIWNAHPKTYGPGSRAWNPTNNLYCTTRDALTSDLEDADRIFRIFLRDNNYWLIPETFRNDSIYQGRGQQLLAEAISFSAFACVVALVKGETALTVDIDLPDSYGRFPLHYAAEILDPGVIELLLYLRARADSRTVKEQLLPLNLALEKFICHRRLKEWTPEHSIFKLITVLCLPKMQNQLESIGLLCWTSEGTEEEFLQYAIYGKLKELAALLTVAHKKLTGPIHTVLNTLPSLQSHVLSDVKKKHLLFLLEVFQKAGDAIEAYVKQEKIGVSVDQAVNTVRCLLQEAGFHLKHEDTDLNCFQWYRQMGLANLTECRWKSKDIHMPHYGKSGYRWMVHNKSNDACRAIGIESLIFDDEDFENLVRDKLWSSLLFDDKEKMISVILQNEIARDKEQDLLLEALSKRAINCITALVKGEAHVTVDLNLPDSLGNFPIHHAAQSLDPSVIELFLYLEARADTPTVVERLLPLRKALDTLFKQLEEWSEWDSKLSIFKLIILLCLPVLQDRLESIGLLAHSIEETEEEFLQLARYGKLNELAVLLMVAHKRLSGATQKVRNLSLALIRENRKKNLFLLLEVFERAGDAIEAYVKQEKFGVTVDQSVKTVACLLQEAGFPLKHEDTDLNDFRWYGFLEVQNMRKCKCGELAKDIMTKCKCIREPKDIHMPHYGKSGYRWMTYNKSSVACRVVDEELLNASKLGFKPVPNDEQRSSTKYSNITTIHDRGVPGAIRGFHSQAGVEAKSKDKLCGKAWIHPLWDVSSRRKPGALLASVIKGVLKHVLVK